MHTHLYLDYKRVALLPHLCYKWRGLPDCRIGCMQGLSATYLTRKCLPHPQPRFARLAPSPAETGEGAARRVSAEWG